MAKRNGNGIRLIDCSGQAGCRLLIVCQAPYLKSIDDVQTRRQWLVINSVVSIKARERSALWIWLGRTCRNSDKHDWIGILLNATASTAVLMVSTGR